MQTGRAAAVLVAVLAVCLSRSSVEAYNDGTFGCTSPPGHSNFNGAATFTLTFNPALGSGNTYSPSTTYTVTLSNGGSGPTFNGFNLIMGAGSFGSAPGGTRFGTSCPGTTQSLRHSNNAPKGSTAISWTAPASGSVSVTAHVVVGRFLDRHQISMTLVEPQDCSSAPNCASQNRAECATQALNNVCGACLTGFTGGATGACSDINACANNPCTGGSFDVCSDLPAPALDVAAGRSCACMTGSTRQVNGMCQNDDACQGNPCGANEDCTDETPPLTSFSCACKTGFADAGAGCVEIDACLSNPCGSNADCTDLPAPDPGTGFTCACQSGFEGNAMTGCTDIDGCASNPCSPNANAPACTDVAASGSDFTCNTCQTGFSGNGISCNEIDACINNACAANAVCSDQPPPAIDNAAGRTCTCAAAFFGDGATSCTACATCPVNQYADGACDSPGSAVDNACLMCPGNSSTSGATGVASIAGCVCDAGFTDTDASATAVVCDVVQCPAREYFDNTNMACTPCATATCGPGLQRVGVCGGSADNEMCVQCDATDFRAGNGLVCAECGSGTEPNGDHTACTPCVPGSAGRNGVCQGCPAGEGPNGARTTCIQCPTGRASTVNGAICELCPGGSTPVLDSTACEPCAATAAGNGNGLCTTCADGTEPNAGRTACVACAAGSAGTGGACAACSGNEVPNAGQTACALCPSGQEKSGNACAACSGTAVGTNGVCDVTCSGVQVPNAGRTACENCPANTETVDNIVCRTVCPAGSIPSASSMSGCEACGLNTEPNAGATACVACAANAIWDAGECTACTAGFFPSRANLPHECAECPAPTVGTNGQCGTTCGAGQGPNPARTACANCPAGTASQSGQCTACSDFKVPNAARTECEPCSSVQTGTDCGTPCTGQQFATRNHSACIPPADHQLFFDIAAVPVNEAGFTSDILAAIETATGRDTSGFTVVYALADGCVQATITGRDSVLVDATAASATGNVFVDASGQTNVVGAPDCSTAQILVAASSSAPTSPSQSGEDDSGISASIVIVTFLVVFVVSFIIVEFVVMVRAANSPPISDEGTSSSRLNSGMQLQTVRQGSKFSV